jgi:serine/threonine protein kinase
MKAINHPHVCKLYDYFRTKKEIYLVMEYVSGISLY